MKNVAHQTYLLELRHELPTSAIKDYNIREIQLYDVITLALARAPTTQFLQA